MRQAIETQAAHRPTGPTPFRHALCVYPYRKEIGQVGFLPPLGLEFIAAVVGPYARSMDLVDLRMEAGRARDFLRPETDLVCLSVNWDKEKSFVEEEVRSIPPGPLTVVGGRHATENPERWLAEFPNVGAVVRGDGEEAMEELCRGVPMEKIAGLSFRRDGRIYHNPNRVLGPLRDDVHPARHLRRRPYVFKLRDVAAGVRVDTISSSRGCPFNCTFCSFSRNPWGGKRAWSARTPESVVDELGGMEARMIGFTDDLFTYDMDRVERICDLLLDRGIRKRYIVNARLEIARRPDVLRKMERAGFSLLALGVESAHDKTLESMRKGFDTAQIREYFKVLRRSRMVLHGYFIVGNIGESVGDIRRIPRFAAEIGLDTLALSTLRARPYSGLPELVAATPGYHITPDGRVYSDHCSVKELQQLRRRLLSQFYSPRRFARILRKALQNDIASFLPEFLPHLPAIAVASVRRIRERSRLRAEKHRALSP